MISERDTKRIRDDAYIAMDSLESLLEAPNLSEDYIEEKVKVVDSCLSFIRSFIRKTRTVCCATCKHFYLDNPQHMIGHCTLLNVQIYAETKNDCHESRE